MEPSPAKAATGTLDVWVRRIMTTRRFRDRFGKIWRTVHGVPNLSNAAVNYNRARELQLIFYASGNYIAPDLHNRTPGEQTVIVALQAVANYLDSREFVQAVLQGLTWPEITTSSPGEAYYWL